MVSCPIRPCLRVFSSTAVKASPRETTFEAAKSAFNYKKIHPFRYYEHWLFVSGHIKRRNSGRLLLMQALAIMALSFGAVGPAAAATFSPWVVSNTSECAARNVSFFGVILTTDENPSLTFRYIPAMAQSTAPAGFYSFRATTTSLVDGLWSFDSGFGAISIHRSPSLRLPQTFPVQTMAEEPCFRWTKPIRRIRQVQPVFFGCGRRCGFLIQRNHSRGVQRPPRCVCGDQRIGRFHCITQRGSFSLFALAAGSLLRRRKMVN